MEVFIEAEAGSRQKGMYDEETLERHGIRRALYPYPYPYGFVLGTRTRDGDRVDCYVITKSKLAEGTTARCDPIGLLEFTEDGEVDHKVLASPCGETPQVDERLRRELEHFITGIFSAYPEMEVQVGRLLPKEAAIRHIEASATSTFGDE